MWTQNQAILPKIGIVLGVVLTCWLLIAIVAAQTQPKPTPTPVRQPSATVRGGATPAAVPRTPTASTFAPPVAPDQPGAVTLRPAIVPIDPSAPPFATDEVRPSRALHPYTNGRSWGRRRHGTTPSVAPPTVRRSSADPDRLL